jgi:hypothetical protein
MRVRHSTGSLVDNICFFVALIVVPCALLLYCSVTTIIDSVQFQEVVAASSSDS